MMIPGGNGAKTFNCNVQEAEIAKLSAMLQKTEMKAKSLEITVEQKNKENEVNHIFDEIHCKLKTNFQELTAICDELIAKVGS